MLADSVFGSLRLLVLQATPSCNLNCRYCYLPDRKSTRRMSNETMAQIFERVLASEVCSGPFTISWHAGEPTTLPISYYETAFALIAEKTKSRVDVRHNMQTNGTRINQDWCRFFLRHNVQVGISIDGPEFIHNRQRVTWGGRGAHSSALRGLRLLRESGVPFAVICVLTRESIPHAFELLDFFTSEGVTDLGFNIDEVEGANRSSSFAEPAERASFSEMLRTLAAAAADFPQLRIREFADMRHRMMSRSPTVSMLAKPFHNISIDSDGNFTVFAPELLGFRHPRYGDLAPWNIWTHSFEEAAASDEFRLMYRDILRGLELCRDGCEYFDVCGGGSPSNKLFENGTFASSRTLDCTLTKMAVADVVLDRLEHELK